jgi:hypothetical protein
VYSVTTVRASDILQLFKSREFRFACLVAIAADGLQILVLPLFIEGALSPADALIDLGAAVILSRVLGWHWAFLPTLLAELFPGLDLFPTWTAAVLYVGWQRLRSQGPNIEAARLIERRLLNSENTTDEQLKAFRPR